MAFDFSQIFSQVFTSEVITLMLFVFFAYYVFIFLWLFVVIKKLLFWSYLWQLKEYHFLRLIDHFRTFKGKKIIFNLMNLLKMISILGIILIPQYFLPLPLFSLIYLIEAYFFIKHILKKKLLKPILTFKTIAILGAGMIFLISFAFGTPRGIFFTPISKACFLTLALIDFSAPFLFSILILSFQPFILIWQKQLLTKAKKKREKFKDLIVIGITGSYGKSSTKEFLAKILSESFNVLKTSKNENSEVGISRLILNNLQQKHEILICEIGAYERGKIKQVTKVVQPKIGILTGINEQHLACFGSLKNTVDAKFELIDGLIKKGIAILNWDNGLVQKSMIKKQDNTLKLKVIKSSVDEQVEDLNIKKDSVSFSIEGVDFKVGLIGRQNIENLLMAIMCARELNLNWEQIKSGIEKIKPFKKTMELKSGKNEVQIIDDSYSANPRGVLSALEHLKLFHKKRIVIMPCLIELGSASKEIHYNIGRKIGEICNLAVITTKDRFKEIKKGAIEVGMSANNILFLENSEKIFEKIKPFLDKNIVILLESRGPEKLIKMLEK